MANLSIKVNIAGRMYPLTVDGREEAQLQKAADELANKLKAFEQSYAVRDKQDLLAMCALQYATEALKQQEQTNEHITQRLTKLEQEVTSALH
jgi:cell division protein ZapA (FtsZ GTPase activity inhibitor)